MGTRLGVNDGVRLHCLSPNPYQSKGLLAHVAHCTHHMYSFPYIVFGLMYTCSVFRTLSLKESLRLFIQRRYQLEPLVLIKYKLVNALTMY